MNKIEVGKTYVTLNSVSFTVLEYLPYDGSDNLYYSCSDAMWRTESGEAFPGDVSPSELVMK